jgi:Flp pilus assembly protein TadG
MNGQKNGARNALRDEQGAALIELAVLLPIFVLILIGITNCTFLIEQRIQLQEAAAAGAAYATIPGNSTDTAGMIAATRAASPQFNTTMAVTAVNVYSCTPGGTPVVVTTVCPNSAGPLLFAQVTTTAIESTILKYTGMPATVTMQGFASYEVVP